MIVGIVGLGLIGGSFAKAYKQNGDHTVFGYDTGDGVTGIAQISGAIDGALDERSLRSCDLILIALYPQDAIAYLRSAAPQIPPDTFVIDGCGTKRELCAQGFRLAGSMASPSWVGIPWPGPSTPASSTASPRCLRALP